ncbi:LacI family DNA-binding transcriptional regulator [Microbacterium soli]|uniref:LacI family DNA-binding transcriptional regulator n=1 Tax=Microbacterium soli TaxID=446075 RepID=A0ABP7N626_9MICO
MTIDTSGRNVPWSPTLEEVAALAGVSSSTASRVINGSPRVTEETIARVNAAIAKVGYVPNRAARNLASRRTQNVAMVIPEQTAEFFADPYFAEVIQGAAMHASSSDYFLSLLIESEHEPHRTRQFLRRGNVDGALVLSHHSASSSYRDLARTLPVVFGVRPPGEYGDAVHVVDVDNVAAGALGTQHLIDRGRRRIATITGPLSTSAGRDRMQGWSDAIAAAGLATGAQEEGDYTPSGGAAAARRLLDADGSFDAVFIASAQMASGALTVFNERGLRVPVDVAVSTVDNNVFSTSSTPRLTTVDVHTSEKGATMMATIIRLISGEQVPAETRVPIDLIVRESTVL